MGNNISKAILAFSFLICGFADAQLFRTRDRMDNLEGFDNKKFSYGFFLAGNHFDYKMVMDPRYGMHDGKNLVQVKPTYSFGAGLIGKMRLNEHLDLRLEPGLHFVEREITFDTQSNDQYSGGNTTNEPFAPRVLTDADKIRNVKSTYLDVPLLIEIHGERWYNSRPYAAAGVNWMMNLQSNAKVADDNQQEIFRTTTSNFGWSAEIGMQFYFGRFKLTPGFRGTFMINDEMVADNPETPPYWADAISNAKTRALMFVLKFE